MNPNNPRAVVYARYSGDRQRETSIDDQVRNCTRHAEREGLMIGRIYQDKAISGSVRARPGYLEMIEAAGAGLFDLLLVDDLSRLSRDDYEMKGLLRRLTWQSVRVIGVTDGYDSSRKGHKIHAGFKGLMNEMFLDDLRERTHRGMSGQAIKGYNCGGRTYGYRNTPIEDAGRKDAYGRPAVSAVRYEIDEQQATVVRQIYDWYADGHSYKGIASDLNRRRVPSSRGGTWALTAVKVILENEMYTGRLTWNRREWSKHPETGKRVARLRPPSDWIVSDQPELRIIAEDVVAKVRERQRRNSDTHARFPFSPAQRYLFSGLMRCAECGGNFVLAAANKYGCAAHRTRGPSVCANGMTVSRRIVEHRLLHHIKERLLGRDSVAKFKAAAMKILESHNASNRKEDLGRQLRAAEQVRENLLAAIKQGILTPSTKHALTEAEQEIESLRVQLEDAEQHQVAAMLPRAVERYEQAVRQLEQTLAGCVEPAREILRGLLGDRIRIHRRGGHLEAEVPDGTPMILAMSLNSRDDSLGCGGPHCSESYWVPLIPDQSASPRVSTPGTEPTNRRGRRPKSDAA